MCLVSKVKFLCGRCGSPAVRLRQPRNSVSSMKRGSAPDVVTSQPIGTNGDAPKDNGTAMKSTSMSSKDLNLALTQAVGEVTRKVKKGNKFTDGLDLSLTTDWASELRPSMKKLRQAMDGLLKTARLMHSVQRLQQDTKKITSNLAIMFRRDVCFSQAVSLIKKYFNLLYNFISSSLSFRRHFFFKPIIYYFTSTNKLEKCEKAAQIKKIRGKQIFYKSNSN